MLWITYLFNKGPDTIMAKQAKRKMAAITYTPKPIAIPMAADIQIILAVVNPFTFTPSLKITPAPRKPIPETTYEAIRVASSDSPAPNLKDSKENKVLHKQIIEMVLKPADLSFHSRSNPNTNPAQSDNTAFNKSFQSHTS